MLKGSLGLMALSSLLLSGAAEASRIDYLAREDPICTTSQSACIDGTLSFESNNRLLWLRGRLRDATGPGVFEIILIGRTRQGFVRYAPMEIELRGKSSEIVDFRMIPDHPDVYEWQIDRVNFRPAAEEKED